MEEKKDDTQRSSGPGLRQRNRLRVKEELTAAAIKLFFRLGFEHTTVDEIVASADVSRRTFFRYFSSKEEVVFGWLDSLDHDFLEEVSRRPKHESPLIAVQNSFLINIRRFERKDIIAIVKLIRHTPALKSRDLRKRECMELLLAEKVRERMNGKGNLLHTRLIAMYAVGSMRVAIDVWADGGHKDDPAKYFKRAFAAAVFKT